MLDKRGVALASLSVAIAGFAGLLACEKSGEDVSQPADCEYSVSPTQ